MEKQLIFFDVDGTILTSDDIIPDSAVEAIRRVQAFGHICVVNTGRPFSHIVPSVREIGFDGYVCSCGQMIRMGEDVVRYETFSPEKSRRYAQLTADCGMDAVFEAEHGVWHIQTTGRPEVSESIRHFRQLGFETGRNWEADDFSFDKFCVLTNPNCDLIRFRAGVTEDFDIIDREGDVLELVKKGNSKANGTRYMAEWNRIPLACTWAIGDSTNDLPMFAEAGHSIAMGNAPEEVKKAADHITDDIREDGLAHALEYILGER